MTKKQRPSRKVRIGKVYLHKTFAGVDVHSRITQVEDEARGIFEGELLREADAVALREAGVPYPKKIVLSECRGVVYDFQIVKEIRGTRKKTKSRPGKRRIVRPQKNPSG